MQTQNRSENYAQYDKQSQVEKWQEIHANSNWNDVCVRGWRLPATGKAQESCGKWVIYGCLNTEKHKDGKAYVRNHPITCFKPTCPVCWDKWAGREANKGTHKLQTYSNKIRKPAKHIVVSVPIKDWHLSFEELKEKVRYILKQNHIIAGCIMFHPFRDKEGIDGYKIWYWSPHFHVIGFGWIESDIVEDTYHETEYVIKNLGVRQSIHATLWYLLSHCGIWRETVNEGRKTKVRLKHSVTWFGDLSYRNIAKYHPECKPEKDGVTIICPLCCRYLYPLKLVHTDRPPPSWVNVKFEGTVDPDNLAYAEIPDEYGRNLVDVLIEYDLPFKAYPQLYAQFNTNQIVMEFDEGRFTNSDKNRSERGTK